MTRFMYLATAFACLTLACSSSTVVDVQEEVQEEEEEQQQEESLQWEAPVQLFGNEIRLAAGEQIHAVGESGWVVEHRVSLDQGATWSDPVPIPGAGQLPIYGPVAAEGARVYVVTRSNGALQVQRSSDRGATWSGGVTLQGYGADNADRVQMATEGDWVHVFVGRAGAEPDPTFAVYYWRSADAGQTFSPVAILDQNPQEPPSPGGIAVENGIVHIGYAAITPIGTLGHRARYMRSVDNGATWSSPIDLGGPGTSPQIRPRPRVLDGRVFVFWEESIDHDQSRPYPNATRSEVRMNASLDNGQSWQGPRDITALPNTYVNHPEFAVGPDQAVHILYRMSANQFTSTSTDPLGYRRSGDYGATWGEHEVAVDDPSQETHPYGVVATNDYLHAASANGVYIRRPLR